MPAIAVLPARAIAEAGHYLHWGVVSVSVTNLLIVLAMLVLFGLALVVPFPRPREQQRPSVGPKRDDAS